MLINKTTNFLILFYSSILLTSIAYAAEEVTSPIQFSGLIESEANIAISQEGKTATASNFALATVELGTDTQLSDNVETHLLLLYEEGENDDNIALIDNLFVEIWLRARYEACPGSLSLNAVKKTQ